MADVFSIALSGLQAQTVRVSAAASNIANAGTTGTVPDGTVPDGGIVAPLANAAAPAAPGVYKPLQVNFTALDSGGVVASAVPDPNGYSIAYDPSSSYANSAGYIATPNVDYAKEAVNLIESKQLFKANISVIKAEDEMLGDLLDTLA